MMDKEKSPKKGIAYFLIGLPIGIAVAVIAIIVIQICQKDSGPKAEGFGYDSPEEAVCSYVENLKNGDVKGMISTFAVESYTEHYDLKNYCDMIQMYNMQFFGAANLMLPGNSNFSKDLNIENRKNDLTKSIHRHYIQKLLYSDEGAAITPGIMMRLDDASADNALTTEELMRFLKSDPEFDQIENISIVSPSDLGVFEAGFEDSEFFTDYVKRYNERYEKIWNTDGIEHIIAKFHIDHEDYYLFMTVGCYEGKWYNIDFNNVYSNSLGINTYHSGFISEEELSGM